MDSCGGTKTMKELIIWAFILTGCATEHDYSHQISALTMKVSALQERVSDLEAKDELKKTSPK